MHKIIISLALGLWALSWLGIMTAPPLVHAENIITVNSSNDSGNTGDGNCELREAIEAANTNTAVDNCNAGSNSDVDVIELNTNVTIQLSGTGEDANATGDFDIVNDTPAVDLIIRGNATIDGNGLDRAFDILSGATVIFQNFHIRNGSETSGAGIRNGGTLTLDQITVYETPGNAINNSGIMTIQNASQVMNNNGNLGGGAGIRNASGATLTLDASSVLDNYNASFGGGIYNSGNLTLQNGSIVDGNQAQGAGGIFNDGTLVIDNSTISQNNALGSGGGIVNFAIVTLQNNTLIYGNTAMSGAGIYNNFNGSLSITNTVIHDNIAITNGGGILNLSNTLFTLNDVEFYNNIATVKGGALMQEGGGGINISGNTLFGGANGGNSANQGGAIYLNYGNTNIADTRFIGNSASDTGGAVFINMNPIFTVSMTNSCIVDNSHTAFYNATSTLHTTTGNWWGAVDGPSGVGVGQGDSVSTYLNYGGFLTSTILGCPSNNNLPVTATGTPTFTFTPSQTFTATTPGCIISVNVPSIISPTHRTHTTDTTPTFNWSQISGALSYRLMIYTQDRSFEFKKRRVGQTSTSYTLTSAEVLAPAKYLWRVRTQDLGCSTWTTWGKRNTLFVD